jgi:hypothetical protein
MASRALAALHPAVRAAQSLPPPLGSAGVLARKPIEWAFVVNFVELPLPPGPARPSRTQHGPRVPRRCFEKAKEQVTDLLLLVEVGRLELPSRGVVPGLLRAQPPVEVRTWAVRWQRSQVLAS